jgi:PmbA protein
MEKLLEMAKRAADQAEIFSLESSANIVSFHDAKLHDIKTNILSGISLRITKGGRLGFAYTRNLTDQQKLLDNALDSLRGGVAADIELPAGDKGRVLQTYDPKIKTLTSAELVEEGQRICGALKGSTGGEVMAGAYTSVESVRILNSKGADLKQESSVSGSYGMTVYPGSGSGLSREMRGLGHIKMTDRLLDEMSTLYRKGEKVVNPKGGRMQVLFMPNSMITLLWRVVSGLSGRSLYEKVSPMSGKQEQQIFSSKLTIYDDPLNDAYPGARSWDDEGVACRRMAMIEKGVLKNYYFDLNYAGKLGTSSNGHGYRNEIWGGDPLTLKPGPYLRHLFIEPGRYSLQDLISMMDRGVIVEGAMGAHSGNIPNGDYSVGISPGFYVENGEIVGRVKDAMAAGNIYDTLAKVVEVGDVLHPSFEGSWVPPLLCDGVSVTTKL